MSLPITLLFLIFVVLAGSTAALPPAVPAIYLGISLLTFLVYARDKSAARSGNWRTRESTLHLLALAGGWPGALLAQKQLRHKTQKLHFQVLFWITAIANCGALAWLFSPAGKTFLRGVPGAA